MSRELWQWSAALLRLPAAVPWAREVARVVPQYRSSQDLLFQRRLPVSFFCERPFLTNCFVEEMFEKRSCFEHISRFGCWIQTQKTTSSNHSIPVSWSLTPPNWHWSELGGKYLFMEDTFAYRGLANIFVERYLDLLWIILFHCVNNSFVFLTQIDHKNIPKEISTFIHIISFNNTFLFVLQNS